MNTLKNFWNWFKVTLINLPLVLFAMGWLGLACKLIKVCFMAGFNILNF